MAASVGPAAAPAGLAAAARAWWSLPLVNGAPVAATVVRRLGPDAARRAREWRADLALPTRPETGKRHD